MTSAEAGRERAGMPFAGRATVRVASRGTPCGNATHRVGHPASRALVALAVLLVATGVALGGRAGWLAAKATLAQHLLERAWEETLATGAPARPWPWADVVPVARLIAPGADVSLVVLQDVSGEAMAFGPGLVAGDPRRAAHAGVALGGHRDSHLAFLEHLVPGAELALEDRNGVRHAYRLDETRVVDSRDARFSLAANRPALVLITCYPFHAAQTGGPLRLIATALPLVT